MDRADDQLYLKFFRKNAWLAAAYCLMVVVVFPLQGIVLPRKYTAMVKAFTDDPKALGSILVTVVVVWTIVLAINAGKMTLNIELFPKGLIHHIRKELYDSVVDRYSKDYEQQRGGRSYSACRPCRGI